MNKIYIVIEEGEVIHGYWDSKEKAYNSIREFLKQTTDWGEYISNDNIKKGTSGFWVEEQPFNKKINKKIPNSWSPNW